MNIYENDDEKYQNFITRYDLKYWVKREPRYLKVSWDEFENDIEKIKHTLLSNDIKSLEIINFNNRLNLANLEKIVFLKCLILSGGDYFNTSYLSCLKNLQRLRIWNENYAERFNLSNLVNLQRLEILNKCDNVDNYEKLKNLNTLVLQNYSNRDMEFLSDLTQLESIELIQPKLLSLNGIKKLSKIKCLTVFYSRYLKDITELSFLTKLEYLEFRNCSKISNCDCLGALKCLKILTFLSCGTINNLKWLSNCTELESCSIMETDIQDGNLDNIVKIKHHAYTNKKHFNYYMLKGKDIKKS